MNIFKCSKNVLIYTSPNNFIIEVDKVTIYLNNNFKIIHVSVVTI